MGKFQTLVTSVEARSESIRNTSGATPFMVLWNNQTGRGVAFHLVAYSTWKMRISKVYLAGEATAVEVELGVLNDGLNITLAPGEQINLPEIIYYEVLNKTDFDCWKLHKYLNEAYPRKRMPVIYDTWMYKFEKFTYDDIVAQIEKAAQLGVEYFVIDAGWFGDTRKSWWFCRGDWEETEYSGFGGRMCEIADLVREKGMKFGFWLEPEGASEGAEIIKNHPEYFMHENGNSLLNFAVPEAMEYICNKTCELIEKYGAEFMKFDFNVDMKFDKTQSAFSKYFEGYNEYIRRIKERYPDMYIENCASGGTRMSIRDGKTFDGFWFSDELSPYYGLRIFKDTILRMPPQWIEKFMSVQMIKDFKPQHASNRDDDKIIACNDGVWKNVSSVNQSFLDGFMTGGAIGLSCDLTSFTDSGFEHLKNYISQFKENRDFWQSATCRILTDTETMLVLEFANDDFSRIELVVFSLKAMQRNICVYPVLNGEYNYELIEGMVKSAKELLRDGIDVEIIERFAAQFLTLRKV